eukprot:TRINITY_DN10257_c0_g1_i1.p1 TRINITY_DN10257_c0_g1~~TRINITY_DN10257_c0_g1_i1.p1  ORF type:complete len:593 (-),score=92.17 TRINITY_DN10257_c0_g1_i1:38-1816(-)
MKFELDACIPAAGARAYMLYRFCVGVVARSKAAVTVNPGAFGKKVCDAVGVRADLAPFDLLPRVPLPEPEAENDLGDVCTPLVAPSLPPSPRSPTKVSLLIPPCVSLALLLCSVFQGMHEGPGYAEDAVFETQRSGAGMNEPSVSTGGTRRDETGSESTPTVWNGEVVRLKLKRQKVLETVVDGILETYMSAYYGTLSLGSPLEEFTFLLDTGSANLVVPSAYCHSDVCKAHKRYRASASNSVVHRDGDGAVLRPGVPREGLTVGFGTGEIVGLFVEDVVCVNGKASAERNAMLAAGDSALPAGCIRLNFLAASDMSVMPFGQIPVDGILGLAMPSLSYRPEFNLLQMLSRDMNMPQMFGLFLSDGEGELSLGGAVMSHLEEGAPDLTWVPVALPEHGHWMVKLKSVRVDGTELDFCIDDCYGVFDSGTALNSVPERVFKDMYPRLTHLAALDGECQTQGPVLSFVIEGADDATLALGPKEYSRPHSFKKPRELQFGKTITDNQATRSDLFCRPLFMTMDMMDPMPAKVFILGEPTLRKYYTVFDADSKRIGFGMSKYGSTLPHIDAATEEVRNEETEEDDSWFFEDDPSEP